MKILKLSLLSLMLISSSVFAKSEGHIVSASSESSIDFTKGRNDNDYDATFYLGVGYDYAMKGGLQFGGAVYTSLGDGFSAVAISAGPGYNFQPNDIENSFFVKANIGVVNSDTSYSTSDTNAFISAQAAKRFKVLENVSYVPGLYVEKILGDNTPSMSFSFQLLSLSLLF